MVARNITLTEDEDIKEFIKIFDPAGKGCITSKELRHIMTNLGEKLTEEEADEMIKDAGGEETIKIDKFLEMVISK